MDVLRSSTLMVLVALYVQCSNSQGTSECVYRYQEQPPTNLECNPYLNDMLVLVCNVEGPTQLAFTPFRWYWVPLNTQQIRRLNESRDKYRITQQAITTASSRGLKSQLGVLQLNDSDAGRYFCRAGLSNGTLLTPSNELILNVQSTYTNISSMCLVQQLTNTTTTCASIESVTVQPTTGNTGNTGITGITEFEITNSATTSANTGPTDLPSVPSPDNTPDDTPVPTPTTIPMAHEPESSTLQVALYIVVAVIVFFCAIILTITIVILYCKWGAHSNSKKTAGTSAPYYSYPSPQPPLHESADGDYIDPSAASPLYHNLIPEAASTEMVQPDERKEVYQSLDPTSVDYTSLYMTTNMQGSVAPTVQEGGREYVIVDSKKRDPPNLYATATTN